MQVAPCAALLRQHFKALVELIVQWSLEASLPDVTRYAGQPPLCSLHWRTGLLWVRSPHSRGSGAQFQAFPSVLSWYRLCRPLLASTLESFSPMWCDQLDFARSTLQQLLADAQAAAEGPDSAADARRLLSLVNCALGVLRGCKGGLLAASPGNER